MAENLCNNPKARVTDRGLSPDKPCGLWEKYGMGWCSNKDYMDWLNLYNKTIKTADQQFLYLQEFKMVKGYGKGLDPKEVAAQDAIEIAKLDFANLQTQANIEKKQDSDTYEKRIAELSTKIAVLDCLIENNIQAKIEILGGPLKPTGLIEGSRESNIGKYFIYGLIGIAGIWAIKNL